ncbi:DUF4190 domain-containing protein [Actinomadura fibrosa]|uniref:Septum formation family protein n=1 Tax=Actinomadura fibrosa TaxID=111802 RepID=A0ABW2XK99_9ACTN|nr:DUF4190 domain-containing protein [Actinomadura fibrosa]
MTTPSEADEPSTEPEAEPAQEWARPDAALSEPPAVRPPAPEPPGQPVEPFGSAGAVVPGARRTNRLAIVALVTGLLCLVPLALGFGVAALVQTGRRNEKGRGLAVGGLVAALAWAAAGAVFAAMSLGSLFAPDRDEAGHIRKSGRVLVGALRVGDCFTGFSGDTSNRFVTAMPCTRPHDGEVAARVQMQDGPYPGDERTTELATDLCERRLTRLLRKSRYSDDLEIYATQPDGTTWRSGDREVTCMLRYVGPGTLTAPLSESVDEAAKAFADMAVGDCFGKWKDDSPTQRVVSCTGPHWSEVYWVQALPAGPYPGDAKVERQADALCDKRAGTVFKGHKRPDRLFHLYPLEGDWSAEDRRIVCLGESLDRPMRGPIVPR